MYDMHLYVNKIHEQHEYIFFQHTHLTLYYIATSQDLVKAPIDGGCFPNVFQMISGWFPQILKAHNKRSSNVIDMFDGLSLMFLMDLVGFPSSVHT